MGRRLLKVFEPELAKIKSEEMRALTKKILVDDCTDYILKCSTASSGKYHPDWSNGEGGLIRHTKAVCKATETILKQMPKYDGEDWDVPYIAAILHDMAKYTENNQQWSHQDHPIRMADKVRQHIVYYNTPLALTEVDKRWCRVVDCIECHMSRWFKDNKGQRLGTLPSSHESWIVAHADMIMAQKFITVQFDENNNVI